MKTRLLGLAILAVVIIAAVVYSFIDRKPGTTEITGFVGGEKIGFLEDAEVQELLADKYHLEIDYARAGSLDMISADHTDRDYLFPSNQTALEMYRNQHSEPIQSEIIFNTPIVLYTRKAVADEKAALTAMRDVLSRDLREAKL